MIYCITPSKADFIRFKEHKYPNRDDVKWIENLDALRGRQLYKGDFFDFPQGYHKFSEETQAKIQAEVHILHNQALPYEREAICRPGIQYLATLPPGYEWRFVELAGQLRVAGCHPEKGVKMYRLDGLTLVEEPIVIDPTPRTERTEFNGVHLPSVKQLNEITFKELVTAKLATAIAPKEEPNCS